MPVQGIVIRNPVSGSAVTDIKVTKNKRIKSIIAKPGLVFRADICTGNDGLWTQLS